MKKRVRALAIACLSLFVTGHMLAQRIFDPVEMDPTKLSAAQIVTYNQVQVRLAAGLFTSVKYITVNDIHESASSGFITVDPIDYFTCGTLVFNAKDVRFKDEDNFTWNGRYIDESDATGINSRANFTLVKNEGLYIGNLTLGNKSYEIGDLGGGIQFICQTNLVGSGCLANQEINTTPLEKASDNPCHSLTTKVLVLYNAAAKQVRNDVMGTAQLAIAQTNLIWANSAVHNKLFLAGVKEITFTQNVNDPLGDPATLASIAVVQNLRAQYKADIVMMLVPAPYVDPDDGSPIVGVAHTIDAGFSQAFCMIEINSSTTGRYTFAHELCHLYGARHENDPDPGNANAHIFWDVAATQKTLMTRIPDGETRIEYLSNPDVWFVNTPTGTNQHNNATQVEGRLLSVAEFFSDPVPKYGFLDANRTGCGPIHVNAVVCDDPELFSYTWQTSYDGIYWSNYAANTSMTFISLSNCTNFGPCSHKFIRCIITNIQTGNVVYDMQVKGDLHCSEWSHDMDNPPRNIPEIKYYDFNEPTTSGKTAMPTGISAMASGVYNVNLYPNPNSGEFKLVFASDAAKNVNIKIYDFTGREVDATTTDVVTGNNEVNVKAGSKLPQGIYFVKVEGLGKPLVRTFTID